MTPIDYADTGTNEIVRGDGEVALCRPRDRGGRAHWILRVDHAGISDKELHLCRHLLVRRRSLDGYDPSIVSAVVERGMLLDAIVEDWPERWGHRHRGIRTVRLLMARRGLHGEPRPAWDRAWIQNRRVSRGRYHPRVWHRGRPIWSLKAFHDAVVCRDRINAGLQPIEAWPIHSRATPYLPGVGG